MANMSNKLIRQAYDELAYLHGCLEGAERYRLRIATDLRRRVAISEWRIKKLEFALFAAPKR